MGQIQKGFSATLFGGWQCMPGRLNVKQSWTVDKYDVPSGDLEFWATRRGIMPEAANQNLRDSKRGPGIVRRVAVAASLAILIGFALHGLT